MSLNESTVEDAALAWFGELGHAIGHGPHLAPGEPAAGRDSFAQGVLVRRLREAIARSNPAIPEGMREDALCKALRVGMPLLLIEELINLAKELDAASKRGEAGSERRRRGPDIAHRILPRRCVVTVGSSPAGFEPTCFKTDLLQAGAIRNAARRPCPRTPGTNTRCRR